MDPRKPISFNDFMKGLMDDVSNFRVMVLRAKSAHPDLYPPLMTKRDWFRVFSIFVKEHSEPKRPRSSTTKVQK